ncbi:hypothetical protein PilKf_02417 [Pillotina sp. SPG140]|jgi:hypothetical protein
MKCHEIQNYLFDLVFGEKLSTYNHIQLSFHIFLCPRCAKKLEELKTAKECMNSLFFPPSSGCENCIMEIVREESLYKNSPQLPLSSWVITGVIVLISLSTAFLGNDFSRIATDSAFMLPFGIIVGLLCTTYGAIFIGIHLKELSERFGLH